MLKAQCEGYLLIFFFNFFFFLKAEFKGEKERKRERDLLVNFPNGSGAGPGHNQEPGTLPWSRTWVTGVQALGPFLLLFLLVGSWIRAGVATVQDMNTAVGTTTLWHDTCPFGIFSK